MNVVGEALRFEKYVKEEERKARVRSWTMQGLSFLEGEWLKI